MFNILVTGAMGFIGSNFVQYLLQSKLEYAVTNLDKLTYAGNPDNLHAIEHEWGTLRYRFVKGDIADRDLIRSLLAGKEYPRPDVVINFAAESHVDRSILDATAFIDTNVKGVQILLDAVREFGIHRFIQVSTDEVYGSLKLEGTDRFRENDPLKPNSPYSASKAAADLLCRAYHQTYGMDLLITRCCNNYGPYQFPEKLIPLMILNALEQRPLPIYGDGQNVREWIHVRDHCRAIAFLMTHGSAGEIYNVGTGEEIPNLQTVRTIIDCVAKIARIPRNQLEHLVTFVEDRPGHDRRYALDSGKLRSLGWRPEIGWNEGIRRTVEWYYKNKTWCDTVRSGEYRTYYKKWYGNRWINQECEV